MRVRDEYMMTSAGLGRHYAASERAVAASSQTRAPLVRFILIILSTALIGTSARAAWRRLLRWILGCVAHNDATRPSVENTFTTSSATSSATAGGVFKRETSLGMLGRRERVSSVKLAQLSYPLLSDVISEEPTGRDAHSEDTPSTPHGDTEGTSSPPSPAGIEGHFTADVRILCETALPLRESRLNSAARQAPPTPLRIIWPAMHIGVLGVSKGFCDFNGFRREEVVGRTLCSLERLTRQDACDTARLRLSQIILAAPYWHARGLRSKEYVVR